MSATCRKCGKAMPKDRQGPDQYCPPCYERKKMIKAPVVEVHPLGEVLSRSLFSLETIPKEYQKRVINSAIKRAMAFYDEAILEVKKHYGAKINEAFSGVFNAVHEGYSAKTAQECYEIINKLSDEPPFKIFMDNEWGWEEYADELQARIKILTKELSDMYSTPKRAN